MSRSIQSFIVIIICAFSNGIVTPSFADSSGVSSHPDDYRWSAGYGLPGMDERVQALAAGSDGLYTGGRFQVAGGAVVRYVARWDGIRWHSLGSGLDVYVNALAADGTDIYVGGGFHDAGGVPVEHIARWNGTAWSALGSGVNGQVYAVAADGGEVYAGGSFHLSGMTPVHNVGHWDGGQWNDLGGGTNGPVNALLMHGGDLYVGGQFTVVGGDSINGIARWNGSSWSQLGDGLQGVIYDIATDGTDIYTANIVSSEYGDVIGSWVQKWDGASWSVVGQHFDGSTAFGGSIIGLTFHEGTLYVASRGNLWKLDGAFWYPISGSGCSVLESYGAELIVGGSFLDIGGVRASYVAGFDGSGFHALAESPSYGFSSTVYDIALSGSDMYVGGDFTYIGSQAFNRIARWDGTRWSGLGGGLDFTVWAVAVNGGSVFAGGYIHGGPQQWQAKMKRWDGSAWHDLAPGYVNGEIDDIVVWRGDVYVGGRFTGLGGVPVVGIARWSGGTWHDVGGGVWGDYNDQSVFCLAAGDDALYAGGRFFGAGAVSALRIAKWDGTNWAPLGEGLIQHPFTISVDGDNVYVGGVITTAGGMAADGVAKWDGTSWHTLGSGLSGGANASAVVDHQVYFGGHGGVRWDGSEWHSLGSGVSGGFPKVDALASDGEFLYVGGYFQIAGDKASVCFAKWKLQDSQVPVFVQSFAAEPSAGQVDLSWSIIDDPGTVGFWITRKHLRTGERTVVNETMLPPGTWGFADKSVLPGETYRYWLEVVMPSGTVQSMPCDATVAPYALSLGQNVPNPFNPSTTISFVLPKRARVTLSIIDVEGRLVRTLVDEVVSGGYQERIWDGKDMSGSPVSSGVYFYRLSADNRMLTRKAVLLR